MTELRVETWTLPAADLGPENPLPPIAAANDLHAQVRVDVSVPVEEREHLGWGAPRGLLPYRLQDGYNRELQPRDFPVVVLENAILRAAFFPTLGGRLWSLVHKPTGRELFSRNPVFQPCNLALRNAWLSGGVEWNLGWTGHWPYTCSPLFAARIRLPDGTPGLRMWEWERVRGMPLQIDAWLPEGSPVLLVRVAIRNPRDAVTPAYWWSNIAVEQHADVRVIVPAESTLTYKYDVGIVCTPIPVHEGRDITRLTEQLHASDNFYCVPAGVRPWITAVNATGRGLFQTSTSRLRGRKLFRWGTHSGGNAWQKFLGTPDYIEIQAGLARTQSHHMPMPPNTTWTWIEAYGDLQADPAVLHGADWKRAQQAAADAIERQVPEAALERTLADSAAWADTPPAAQDLLCRGAGWGALESLRRAADGEPRMELPGIFFPADSLGPEQQPWRVLLETGALPEADPLRDPPGYQVQRGWRRRLEQSLAKPGGRHWFALFEHGVAQWHLNRRVAAALAWQESIALRDNPWAERCLGVAAMLEERPADAVPHLRRAFAARPDLLPLLVEYLQALIQSRQHRAALDVVRALPPERQRHGRIRLLEGQALLGAGELDALERLLAEAPIAPDQREGETGLTDLWFALHIEREARKRGRPLTASERAAFRAANRPPAAIDYRMWEV
jgi:hypothetical protein